MSMQMRELVARILVKNGLTFEDLKELGFIKIAVQGFPDLRVDYLGKRCGLDRLAIAHNSNPDMEFLDDGEKLLPVSMLRGEKYQVSLDCKNNQLIRNVEASKKLTKVADRWAKSLIALNFVNGECTTITEKPCKIPEKKMG